jgi:hypothetical protein
MKLAMSDDGVTLVIVGIKPSPAILVELERLGKLPDSGEAVIVVDRQVLIEALGG